MSEDNALRAIVIGTTLTILIITLTAIVLYYNKAVDVAQVALSTSRDYGDVYNKDITEIKDMSLSGTELVSIIRNSIKDYDSISVICDGVTITVEKDSINNVKDSNLANINKSDNYCVTDITTSGNAIILELIKTAL